MLKITKKIEYSLIALKHIGTQKNNKISTAKEISSLYRIPRELLAKILQQLTRDGFIQSVQGPKGGYSLARRPKNVYLIDLITTIEGESVLIECISESGDNCIRSDDCVIRSPMQQINKQMLQFFKMVTLEDVIFGKIPDFEFV